VSKRPPEFSYLNSYLCTFVGFPFTAAIPFLWLHFGRQIYLLWLLPYSPYWPYWPGYCGYCLLVDLWRLAPVELSLVELWSLCAGQRRQLPSINQVGRSNCIFWASWSSGGGGAAGHADAQIWMLNKTAPAYRIINFCAFVSLTSKKGTKISNYLWRAVLLFCCSLLPRLLFPILFFLESRRKPGRPEERHGGWWTGKCIVVGMFEILYTWDCRIKRFSSFKELPTKGPTFISLPYNNKIIQNTTVYNEEDEDGGRRRWCGMGSQIKLNKTEC